MVRVALFYFLFFIFIYFLFLFCFFRLYPIDKSRSVEGGGPVETKKKVVNETSEARNEGEKKEEEKEEETKKDK